MTEYDQEFEEFHSKNISIQSGEKLMNVSQTWMDAVKEFNYSCSLGLALQ